MFDTICRWCTGESLEISQEMNEQNGDSTLIDNETEISTAIMLQTPKEEEEMETIIEFNNEKLSNNCKVDIKLKKRDQIKMKQNRHGEQYKNFAR